jgi:hypothetical protein
MPVTIGDFDDFRKALPKEMRDANQHRQEAVKKYLLFGGIIKIEETGRFPTLVYPDEARLKQQMEEARKKLEDLNKQVSDWDKRFAEYDTSKLTDMVGKFAEPLYWEHAAKLVADPTYREVYDKVSPPMHLIHRGKWKKRLRMFVKSKEYRLRLHEARTSVIGRKREPMTKEVENRLEFNRQLVRQARERLLAKRKELEERLAAMRALEGWARGH